MIPRFSDSPTVLDHPVRDRRSGTGSAQSGESTFHSTERMLVRRDGVFCCCIPCSRREP